MSTLTDDQRELLDRLGMPRVPGGTFTPDQFRAWTAVGFSQVCTLEGVPAPEPEILLAEIDWRYGGRWPSDDEVAAAAESEAS